MYLFAHALAQCAVDELMLAYLGNTAEERAHDDRFEVMAVSGDLHVIALETLFDALLDEVRVHFSGAQLVSGAEQEKGQQ